jgi:hypothetical protein
LYATTTTKSALASNNNNGNTITAQINTQDGTQSGFDNTQEQEAQNTICTHPGDNASCVSEGAAASAAATTTTTTPKTCVGCFTTLLTSTQISKLLSLSLFKLTLDRLCALLEQRPILIERFEAALTEAGVSTSVQAKLIQCLKNVGIKFATPSSPGT